MTNLLPTYYRLLAEWARAAEPEFHVHPDDPEIGYYGSGYKHWGYQTVANFANGVGRSAGNGMTGAVAGAFETALPPPMNWAVGLTVFQVFFLPTGYCYYRAAQTSPGDITEVRSILSQRAKETRTAPTPDR
mgnify:CR=1 FL=1